MSAASTRRSERERSRPAPASADPTAHGPPEGWEKFAVDYGARARRELADSIVPFWWRTIDETRGGVFNCWNNEGTRLVCRDKFTWSQGRFAWLWSRLAQLVAAGGMPGDAAAFVVQAQKTVAFLERHAFLPDGRCAFLLSEEGVVKEAFAGAGAAPSIYADCFALMGFAEFARASGRREPFEVAWRLCEQIERRMAAGDTPTFPHATPPEFEAHALAMIYLNLTLVLVDAARELKDARLPAAWERSVRAAARIFDRFLLPGGRIVELRRAAGPDDHHSLLGRHVIPGHALEGLWMLLTVAAREGRTDWMARAMEAVRFALERGWDEAHGGLLYFVDCDGGEPTGTSGSSSYEQSVRGSWDSKLWWVHSEALYATALSYRLSGDVAMRRWFERLWDYTLRVFPHPDREVGEWIQIRNRRGQPLERVVALPVKDPYHVARNLIQLVELFR